MSYKLVLKVKKKKKSTLKKIHSSYRISCFATVLVGKHSPQGTNAKAVLLTLPAPTETRRAKLPEQPRHSQSTFCNYNRSCWLLHSCKSGPYLWSDSYKVAPKLLSCSNFSFNQLKSQFSPWYFKTVSLIWGARCAKSPKKTPLQTRIAMCWT